MTDTLDPPSPAGLDVTCEPAAMTPSQRRRELAAILARCVLRLRQCRQNTHDSRPSRTAGKAPEFRRDCLDEGAKTSPDVPAG